MYFPGSVSTQMNSLTSIIVATTPAPVGASPAPPRAGRRKPRATPAPVGASPRHPRVGRRHPCAAKCVTVAQILCSCAGFAPLSRFPDRRSFGWDFHESRKNCKGSFSCFRDLSTEICASFVERILNEIHSFWNFLILFCGGCTYIAVGSCDPHAPQSFQNKN